jgi:phosphate-selective porin OprO and OprP
VTAHEKRVWPFTVCHLPFAIVTVLAAVPQAAFGQSPPPPRPAFTFTGYVQTQYERVGDQGSDGASDRVLFRRAYLAIEVTPAEHWVGRLQFDFAPVTSGDRLLIKDAYMRYTGWQARGLTVTIGNQKIGFSRSVLASSSRRGLVERPISGERAYGSPGRGLSIKLDGVADGGKRQWSATLGSSLHAPSADEIRVDGIADSSDDWNEGVLAVGRFELHPFGSMPRDHGDFARGPFRLALAVGAYAWRNDGDRNLHTDDGRPTSREVDAQSAAALELSGGLRGHGVTLETEYHHVAGHTVAEGFSGGLYENGRAVLNVFGIEGGYMLRAPHLEVLGAFDTLQADTLEAVAHRPAIGVNWYFAQHNVKLQLMHRETFNDKGVRDARVHVTYAQAQFAF